MPCGPPGGPIFGAILTSNVGTVASPTGRLGDNGVRGVVGRADGNDRASFELIFFGAFIGDNVAGWVPGVVNVCRV